MRIMIFPLNNKSRIRSAHTRGLFRHYLRGNVSFPCVAVHSATSPSIGAMRITQQYCRLKPGVLALMCFDPGQRRFDFVDRTTGKILVDLIDDSTAHFLVIVLAQFAERMRRRDHHQFLKVAAERTIT